MSKSLLMSLPIIFVKINIIVMILFLFFFFEGATPVAYGVSQARGRIEAVAAGLHHSNMGSEPHL